MPEAVHPVPTSSAVPPWLRWGAVVLWMGLIFFMSAQPNSGAQSAPIAEWVAGVLHLPPTPDTLASVHHAVRKTAHFSEYAVLAGLLWAAFGPRARRALLAWGCATAYAASDEFHQVFVANRGPAVTDVLIDSAGALALTLVLVWWSRRR